MKIFQNIPAAQKILASLVPLQPIKIRIDSAHAKGDLEAEKAAILDASRTWGDFMVRQFKADVKVEGLENLPTEEEAPVVYVCNHQGYADVPVLCSVLTTVQFGFLAKDVLRQIPIYGAWMKRVRSVMIDREDARASLKAIAQAISFIEEGSSMLVFPEGTRSWGGPMNEFKGGAFKLATKPQVPIIPISLCGTYTAFEEPGYFKNGQEVRLIIHEPIPTEGLGRKDEKALVEKVYNIIAQGVGRLRSEMGLPEHTAEEVVAMKGKVNSDKLEAEALKQIERFETNRGKEAVKAETRAAKEAVKNETRAAKEQVKEIERKAKEEQRKITEEAKGAAEARIKEAKAAAEARIKEAKENAELNLSAAILEKRNLDEYRLIDEEDLPESLSEELAPETADLPHPVGEEPGDEAPEAVEEEVVAETEE